MEFDVGVEEVGGVAHATAAEVANQGGEFHEPCAFLRVGVVGGCAGCDGFDGYA